MSKRVTPPNAELPSLPSECEPELLHDGKVLPFPEHTCGHCALRTESGSLLHTGGLKIPAPYGGFSFLPTALQRWRSRMGLKISAAAQGLGVAASTWGHWETGYRFPTGSVLRDLVEYTGLSLVELICEHGETCPLIHKVQAPRPEPRQGA